MIKLNNLERSAMIFREKVISYREMIKNIHGFADLFVDEKVDKVAIFSENRPEWIYAFYAAWRNNATAVPIDFMSMASDVAYVLEDSKPEVVFTSKEQKSILIEAIANCGYNPKIVVFDELDLDHIASERDNWSDPKNMDDTAVIIYTSGTTGSPKGVMLSYTNLEANVWAVTGGVTIYTEDMETLLLLPLHHIFPLGGSMLIPLASGGTIVIAASMQPNEMMETLKNNKVNLIIGVPRLYEIMYKGVMSKMEKSKIAMFLYRLAKRINSKSFSRKIFKKVHDNLGGNLEFMIAGGAALSSEVGAFWKIMGFEILEGYGMTEASPMITFTRPGKIVAGSPGEALQGIQIRFEEGEILAKGRNIMKGYYNRPEETADVLKDGWLYTGDLGYMDEKGLLFITGRKKEIIVTPNGKNINPVELESKLDLISEGVKESGVILHQDQLHAIVVPEYSFLESHGIKDIDTFFKKEVFSKYNESVSSYKRIVKFTIINMELPRTRLSKIQRYKLEEFIAAAEAPRQEETKDNKAPLSKEYAAVKDFIEAQVDMEILPEHHIEFDIALDSLAKMNLIDFIEKNFGVKIDEERLLKFPSISNMVDHIRENKLFHKVENINWSQTLKERVNVTLPRTWPTTNWIRMASKLFFKFYFRLTGVNRQAMPEGACIIAPNHQSFIDGLLVASYINNRTMNDTYFYAKKEHINNALLRGVADRNNVIVMDLKKDLKESIQKMAEVLRQGKKLIIFPEGTRTYDGSVGTFKTTFAILSKELNVPILPVAIRGAYNAMPRGSKFVKPFKKIEVEFLDLYYPEEKEPKVIAREVKEMISQRVY
ncbi:AMP-binding protein [Halosquirtibacter xylanolyticus]|uniref:AMP-binding protein n=1 Tax=Halosquirtibacter xylanolyticus TaxID=3374599 RepID=UPI0037490FCE|nr:AMP-binding protein [Prolixibacteraceae bacterium]